VVFVSVLRQALLAVKPGLPDVDVWRQRVQQIHHTWAHKLYTRDRDITPGETVPCSQVCAKLTGYPFVVMCAQLSPNLAGGCSIYIVLLNRSNDSRLSRYVCCRHLLSAGTHMQSGGMTMVSWLETLRNTSQAAIW
jgi:hypothetical protein